MAYDQKMRNKIFDQALKRHGISGKWLSQESGVSEATISKFRKGRCSITVEVEDKLIACLPYEVRKDYFSEILGGACSERLPDLKQVIEQVDLAQLPDGLNAIAHRLRLRSSNSADSEVESVLL
jgi:transcriptional regulator with XRE-family HTH domain